MPNESNEMTTAVTRSELRDELVATRSELRKDIAAMGSELRAEIAASAESVRAEITASAESVRAEITASAESVRAELRGELAALKSANYNDFAHLFRTFEETIIARMVALLEPQKDHEPRIKALEAVVFAPSPPRKRRRGE